MMDRREFGKATCAAVVAVALPVPSIANEWKEYFIGDWVENDPLPIDDLEQAARWMFSRKMEQDGLTQMRGFRLVENVYDDARFARWVEWRAELR